MADPVRELFDAFKEDHADLGRGLYELSSALRGGDLATAREAAIHLDAVAGPHIAFEEQHFYPALRQLIGDEEVERFYREHATGFDAVLRIEHLAKGAEPGEAEREELLKELELMESHVVECGELFGALGRIPVEEQEALLGELRALRESGPRWSEIARRSKPQ